MRMKGHAQHDPAEYVPKKMFEYWKARDPLARYEEYLTANKIWDAKVKAKVDARIERELDEDQKFAEESPLPPAELAEQGVYCDGCHTIDADWQRPKEEVMPPKSSVKAEWTVEDFGGLDGMVRGARPEDEEARATDGDGRDGARAAKKKIAVKSAAGSAAKAKLAGGGKSPAGSKGRR